MAARLERWGLFEALLRGPPDDGTPAPFELNLTAVFVLHGARARVHVRGFFDGGDVYRVRFSPPQVGRWQYVTASPCALLNGIAGTLEVEAAASGNHGPVQSRGFGFVHADGTPHFSVGTTSYQWASEPLVQQERTLQTLRAGYFNKMRMTVFPKWYIYNHANPVEVGAAFEIKEGSLAANSSLWSCVGEDCRSLSGSFNFRRFNVSFWRNFERLLNAMKGLHIIADVILFHPYDRGHWGFDCMGGRDPANYNVSNDQFYLRYLASRLSAFSNVWWSMANEWDFCSCKGLGLNASSKSSVSPIWDELFKTLKDADPYNRQMSIHNGALLYNHSQPWISHVSLQGFETETAALRARYGKPVVWDEVRYEGDLACCGWGALTAEEMVDRFWWGASLGVFVGHSETLLRKGFGDDDQPLWWAKGGELIGRSPKRILWMRDVWASALPYAGEFGMLMPTRETYGSSGGFVANMLLNSKETFLFLHFLRSGRWSIPLPQPKLFSSFNRDLATIWNVVGLNYWDMHALASTLPFGARNVTIECSTLPCNVMLIREAHLKMQPMSSSEFLQGIKAHPNRD